MKIAQIKRKRETSREIKIVRTSSRLDKSYGSDSNNVYKMWSKLDSHINLNKSNSLKQSKSRKRSRLKLEGSGFIALSTTPSVQQLKSNRTSYHPTTIDEAVRQREDKKNATLLNSSRNREKS